MGALSSKSRFSDDEYTESMRTLTLGGPAWDHELGRSILTNETKHEQYKTDLESKIAKEKFERVIQYSDDEEEIKRIFDGKTDLFNNVLVRECSQRFTDPKSQRYHRFELIIYLEFSSEYIRIILTTTKGTIERIIHNCKSGDKNGQYYFSKNVQCFQFLIDDAFDGEQRSKKLEKLKDDLKAVEKYPNSQNESDNQSENLWFQQKNQNLNGFQNMLSVLKPLQSQLTNECQYLRPPLLTGDDYESLLNVIQHLFTSPSLLTEKWFYDMLTINDESNHIIFEMSPIVAEYLRWIGVSKLSRFNQSYFNELLLTVDALFEKQWQFHTIVVAERPLNHDKLTQHWIIKFIGTDMLLSVERSDATATATAEKSNNIRITALENTSVNRNIFWCCDSPLRDSADYNFMTRHYTVNSGLLHRQCCAAQIARYIEAYSEWWSENGQMSTDCQQFAQQFMAAFDIATCKSLTPELINSDSGKIDLKQLCVSFNESWQQYCEWKYPNKSDPFFDMNDMKIDDSMSNIMDDSMPPPPIADSDMMDTGMNAVPMESTIVETIDDNSSSIEEDQKMSSDIKLTPHKPRFRSHSTDEIADNTNSPQNESKRRSIHRKAEELNRMKQFFERLELSQYLQLFVENGFEKLEMVKTVTETDMREMGMKKIGHRRYLLSEIQKIGSPQDLP